MDSRFFSTQTAIIFLTNNKPCSGESFSDNKTKKFLTNEEVKCPTVCRSDNSSGEVPELAIWRREKRALIPVQILAFRRPLIIIAPVWGSRAKFALISGPLTKCALVASLSSSKERRKRELLRGKNAHQHRRRTRSHAYAFCRARVPAGKHTLNNGRMRSRHCLFFYFLSEVFNWFYNSKISVILAFSSSKS